jgi:hypothetical protein
MSWPHIARQYVAELGQAALGWYTAFVDTLPGIAHRFNEDARWLGRLVANLDGTNWLFVAIGMQLWLVFFYTRWLSKTKEKKKDDVRVTRKRFVEQQKAFDKQKRVVGDDDDDDDDTRQTEENEEEPEHERIVLKKTRPELIQADFERLRDSEGSSSRIRSRRLQSPSPVKRTRFQAAAFEKQTD